MNRRSCKEVIDARKTAALASDAVPWRKAIVTMSGALLLGVLGSACSHSAQGVGRVRVSSQPAPGTSGERASVNAAVLRSWRAAELAFHDAAETSDPEFPALSSTMVDPQLARARMFLAEMEKAGDVATGPTSLGNPQVVSVVGTRAVVVSCTHDGEVEIDSRTRQPVPGVLGQVTEEEVTSGETLTKNGWRVADQSVVVGACGS